MHGVDLGQMTPERSARPHLDATDRFHRARCLRQRGVARGFASIL